MTKNYYDFLRSKLLFTFLAMGMLFSVQTGWGQIAAWDFTGGLGSEVTVAATTLNSNLNSSIISRGPGLNASALGNAFSATDYTASGTLPNAITNGDYMQYAINAKVGFTVSLSTLDVYFRRSGTGPNAFQWQYSLDGFATAGVNIGSAISYTSTATNGDAQTQISLTGITALQNVPNSTTITIRLYGWGASATTGTFAIGRPTALVNDLAIGGSVNSAAVIPTVTTPTFTAVTTTTATLGGNITSNGGASLTNRGVVWSSINTSPTIGGANCNDVPEGGTSTGVFTKAVTGLPSSTLIYFKAYAINSVGPGYTTVSSFTTSTPVTPTLTVSATSPSFGNVCLNVQSSESSFTVSGINLTAGPVVVGPLANYQFSLTPGGSYSSTVNIPYTPPTLASTTVYVVFTPTAVQSYNGTVPVAGGGDSKTSAVTGSGVNTAPTTASGSASAITYNTATVAGTISNAGCTGLSAYGIEYSTLMGFGNGTGTTVASTNLSGINFSSALSGLTSATTYYYHSYATNGAGTSYGSEQSFTTTGIDAPVATAATNVTTTSFDANWNVVTGATGYFLDVSLQPTFLDPTPTNLVEFSFPSSPDDNAADGGTGANGSATINTNATGSISYTGVGGSNTSAASLNGWDNGNGTKYWETEINTQNFYNITVSSAQRSSGTGPRDFKLQYKIGAGGTYTDVAGGTILVATNWTSGVLTDLALPPACENQTSVFLRWIMTSNTSVNAGTVAGGGTSGIDEIFVNGNAGDFVFGYENLSVGNVLTYPVTGLTQATTYYYRVRAADGGSTSDNSNTISVMTVDPCITLAVAPTNDGPVCQGSTLNLFANPSGGTPPYASFQWSGPSGFTSSNEDVSFGNGLNGVYTVTVTDDIGCTISNTTTAQVDPAAVVNAGNNQAKCYPATATMNGSIGGSATMGTWSTSGDGSFDNVNLVNAVYTPGVADSTNGSVTLTFTTDDPGTTCGAASDFMILTIAGGIPAQPDPVVGAPSSVCPPSGTINLSIPAVPGATSYSWNSVSPGVSFLSNINSTSVSVQYNASPNSTYNIHAEAINACGTSPYRVALTRRSVGTPAAVLGSDHACAGDIVTYVGTAVNGAESYTWTGPAGTLFDGNPTPYTALDLSVDVTFPAGFTTGSICVAANVACFTSPSKCITVTAMPAQPSAFSGTFGVCPGSTNVAYSVTNVPGYTYTWTAPANGTISSGQGTNAVTIDYSSNFTSGELEVYATSSCGTSGIRHKTVVASSGGTSVGRPGSITGLTDGLCGTTQSYTANPLIPGATYFWTFPAGSIINNQLDNTVQVTYPSGFGNSSISVYAQLGCVSGATRTVGIKGGPNAPVISGPATVCANTGGYQYSVPLRPGLAYSWSVPAGATISAGQGTEQITVSFGATAGQISCNQSNTCGSGGGKIITSVTCRMSDGSTGVANAIEFSAYPNPASSVLNVELTAVQNGNIVIQLMDMAGKVISNESHTASEGQNIYTMDISKMAKGIYVLNVTTGQGTIQSKVVVE